MKNRKPTEINGSSGPSTGLRWRFGSGQHFLQYVFGPNSTDFTNGVLSLPEFNNLTGPLAGDVLTGVTLTLAASDDIFNPVLSNISGAPKHSRSREQSISIQMESTLWSPPPAGTSVDSSDEITLNTIHLFNTGTIVLGPTGLGACPEGTPSGTCSSVAYTPPDVIGTATGSINSTCVSCYIGSGTLRKTAETDTGTTFSNAGGNINLSQVTTADVFATVTYTYSIPSSTSGTGYLVPDGFGAGWRRVASQTPRRRRNFSEISRLVFEKVGQAVGLSHFFSISRAQFATSR